MGLYKLTPLYPGHYPWEAAEKWRSLSGDSWIQRLGGGEGRFSLLSWLLGRLFPSSVIPDSCAWYKVWQVQQTPLSSGFGGRLAHSGPKSQKTFYSYFVLRVTVVWPESADLIATTADHFQALWVCLSLNWGPANFSCKRSSFRYYRLVGHAPLI